jgi:hypothetical protein
MKLIKLVFLAAAVFSTVAASGSFTSPKLSAKVRAGLVRVVKAQETVPQPF